MVQVVTKSHDYMTFLSLVWYDTYKGSEINDLYYTYNYMCFYLS